MLTSPAFEARLIKVPVTEELRRLTVHSTGEALELLLDGSPNPIYSVVDCHGSIVRSAHNWLSYLGRQVGQSYSIKTVEQYGRTLTYLCRWIEAHPPYKSLDVEGNIKLLSRNDVLAWQNAMKNAGARSKKTRHSREACLREFLDWLTTQDGGKLRDSENSPWGRDGSLRYVVVAPNARNPKFIPTEMVIDVLNGMHNECERVMFHTQYDMGLRIGELVDLTLCDIPNDEMYDTAFEFIPIGVNGVKGRGGEPKERITLISRAVLKRIKHYHSSLQYKLAPDWDINDPKKPAFLTVNQHKWSERNATKQFKNSVKRHALHERLRPHWLRHGTAYSVLRSDMGKDFQDRMLIVQQMLGHAHLTTTELYTQISPAMLASLTKAGKEINRLGEAEYIREKTFLGPLQHKEKRGHRE